MEIKEQFEKDTKNHKVEILQNDGLYRHLKCTNNGSQVYRFDITTWPGHLCISGDMGTYVFSRIPDMFEFFNTDKINPGYWGEKLQAIDPQGKYQEFSEEAFRENVLNEYNMFAEQFAETIKDEREDAVDANELTPTEQMLDDLWETIEDVVLPAAYDGQTRAYDAAMDFKWESDDGRTGFAMQDFWDYNCRDFTYHYIWILYAITWAIQALPEGFQKASGVAMEEV